MKAYLEVLNFAGIAPGACHFMGNIHIDRELITVERELTTTEARRLNLDDMRKGGESRRYKAGDLSGRFTSEDALIKRAIEIAERDHPEITLLFKGASWDCDPQPVLLGPWPLRETLNALVAEAEAIGYWDRDRKAMQAIADRWEAALA